jgi:hypothetical protein
MRAEQLYLHLRSLGLTLSLEKVAGDSDSYTIGVKGLENLKEYATAFGRERLVRKYEPNLVSFMRSGSPSAVAVRQEADYGSNPEIRKEATA